LLEGQMVRRTDARARGTEVKVNRTRFADICTVPQGMCYNDRQHP
jgi:hypothetical protein